LSTQLSVFSAGGIGRMSQSVGEVLIESLPPPSVQIKRREIGQRWVRFFLVIFDRAVIFLQLQLHPAPPVVDKVNNLQILRRERETLLGTLQAGRPGIFYISHLDWSEHNLCGVR